MFRTELTLAPSVPQFSRTARVLTIGSCFADSIGARLAANKVETLVNPFGTVFQPLILGQLLRAAAGEEMDWQQHVTEARGRWQSYDLHGSIGASSPVELLQHIQQLTQRVGEFVRRADVVVLTLGTAWAYRLRETGELVNNCHKQSADLFHKELLTPDEIINALAETHAYLRRINPEVKFILTVSPVRHLKDTLPLNAVSKSVLRVACHYLSELLPGVAYFPAFELLTDDLRDYRFYASDMLHPSEVAEDYIWEKFARTYFDADFGRFRKEWAAVRQSLNHRPLHDGAPEHRQFLEATRERLQRLAGQQVDVAAELQDVEQRIAALPLLPVPVEPEIEDDGEERIDVGGVETRQGIATAADTMSSVTDETPEVEATSKQRLSPEEFRSQRNRDRDRRGRNDRRNRNERTPRPEPAEEAAELLAVSQPEMAEEAIEATAPELVEDTASAFQVLGLGVPDAVQTTVDAGEVLPEGTPKKKKRRSRGGAKRTARKHAARLAAEEAAQAAGSELVADVLPVEVITVETAEPVAAVEFPEAAQSVAAVAETLPEVPTTETGLPEANPQWSSRREGKKSTVIQKSKPVKRGGKRLLFNTPPVVENPLVEATPAVEPPLPELPAVVAVPVEPELPIIGLSAAQVEAIGNELPVMAPAAKAPAKSKSRSRGKGSKMVVEAVPKVSATEATPAAAAIVEATPEPVAEPAAATPAPARRKPSSKPKAAETPVVEPAPVAAAPVEAPAEIVKASASKKTAAKLKAAVKNTPAVPIELPVEAPVPQAPAAKSKAKAKPAATPKPVVVKAEAATAAPKVAKAPAEKAKPATAKPTAAKAPKAKTAKPAADKKA